MNESFVQYLRLYLLVDIPRFPLVSCIFHLHHLIRTRPSYPIFFHFALLQLNIKTSHHPSSTNLKSSRIGCCRECRHLHFLIHRSFQTVLHTKSHRGGIQATQHNRRHRHSRYHNRVYNRHTEQLCNTRPRRRPVRFRGY